MEIKLSDVPLVELKALVYDIMASIEQDNQKLQIINQEIKLRNDKKNQPGLPSKEQDGEKPVETQPVEETSS